MGMFDDELKKMDEESAAAERASRQRANEKNQLAQRVHYDLLSFLPNRRRGSQFEVGVEENRVSLREKSENRVLVVVCDSEDVFAFVEGNQFTGLCDRRQMLRRVISWVK